MDTVCFSLAIQLEEIMSYNLYHPPFFRQLKIWCCDILLEYTVGTLYKKEDQIVETYQIYQNGCHQVSNYTRMLERMKQYSKYSLADGIT